MVRCLLSIISTSLNVFVRLIQRIQSSLLQTGINLILPPFTVTVALISWQGIIPLLPKSPLSPHQIRLLSMVWDATRVVQTPLSQ